MSPDPGKSSQPPQSPPADSVPGSDTSDDDFDDEDGDSGLTPSGYQPLSSVAPLDSEAPEPDCDGGAEDESEGTDRRSRVADHIRTHMMPDDDTCSPGDELTAAGHEVQSFQLSKGKMCDMSTFEAESRANQVNGGIVFSDDSEKIKSVMRGFQLPASAIPDWAQVVPEENWKSLLDQRIRDKIIPNK